MLIDLITSTFIFVCVIIFSTLTIKKKRWKKRYFITLVVAWLFLVSALYFYQINSTLEEASLTADNLQTLLIFAFGASLISDLPNFAKRHRNQILTILIILFAVSSIFALPYEPEFNAFTPKSEAYFQLGNSYYHYLVYLNGRGGISAGNPLNFNVTLYTNETTLSNYTVNSVSILFNGSLAYPLLRNNEGFLKTDIFLLHNFGGNRWSTIGQVIYYSAGDWGTTVTLNCTLKANPYRPTTFRSSSVGNVQISSEDVTVLSKTNAYLLSLSFAFLSFVCLELRVKDDRKAGKKG